MCTQASATLALILSKLFQLLPGISLTAAAWSSMKADLLCPAEVYSAGITFLKFWIHD